MTAGFKGGSPDAGWTDGDALALAATALAAGEPGGEVLPAALEAGLAGALLAVLEVTGACAAEPQAASKAAAELASPATMNSRRDRAFGDWPDSLFFMCPL